MKKVESIDHDRLFKELLETFFIEFVALFFPDAYREIDLTHLNFLQQEVFTDVTVGDKHRVDLLVETKLRNENGLILIHVETQSYFKHDFAERMFIYFNRLYQKFRRKILPIVVFSYDEDHDEPDCFQIGFPFLEVLKFHFYKLELKKRNWREYIESDNPVAAALLSKMGYQPDEKVRVKVEFIRMLTRLRLDPARMTLLAGFFETYLKLNETEEKVFQKEIQKLDQKELTTMMQLTTSWHEKGRAEGYLEGKLEGKSEVVKNMLAKNLAVDLIAEVTGLSKEEINKIKEEMAGNIQ
jgi:hypothetical protein